MVRLHPLTFQKIISLLPPGFPLVWLLISFPFGVTLSSDACWKRPKNGAAGRSCFSKGVRPSYACWKCPKYGAADRSPLSKKNSPPSHFLTFLFSTLPTWEDNSPARRASIIHVSLASSGLSFLNIVFIPSKYPLNISFFHAKRTLVIFFLHSFPSIRSTINTCMGAYLLSFLVHFLPYVLSSSNHLESIL